MPTIDEKQSFLKDDLRDSLRWLFVGAIAWEAAHKRPDRCANQDALGMYTNLVQSRVLYDFFYKRSRGDDDAQAHHFAPSWNENGRGNPLYRDYMAREKPANKRVFHLVYKRSEHAGGPGHDGLDHLKNQVVKFAEDLRKLTERLIDCVERVFRNNAQFALQEALNEARSAADKYGITIPF